MTDDKICGIRLDDDTVDYEIVLEQGHNDTPFQYSRGEPYHHLMTIKYAAYDEQNSNE
jgi:hypothetical protein